MVGKWLVVCLVLGSFSVSASAQEADEGSEGEEVAEPSPSDEQARAYFVLGRSAYDAGDYVEAIERFGRAYELSQRPDLLFNLYQAHHRAGQLAPAVDHLERYLEQGSPSDLQRGTLSERLTNLRQQLEQETEQRQRDAEEAERRRLAELERTRAETQSGSMRTAGFVVLGIGAAAAVTFGVLAGLALKEDGELEDSCSPVCSGGQLSKLRSFNRGADVSMALAGVGIVTGIVLLLVAPDADASEETRVEAFVGPRAAALGIEGRF